MKRIVLKNSRTKKKRRGNSKEPILEEAFKLFAVKTYEQVTFNDLEAATGLTRGTVTYHFKSKELLFKQVIDRYLFGMHSVVLSLPDKKGLTLLEFINFYITWIENTKTSMSTVMGITNMNASLLNITVSAKQYYKNFDNHAIEFHHGELKFWVEIIQQAITSGEINPLTNVATYSNLFQQLYYGISYIGSFFPLGMDIDALKRSLLEVYNLIKN